MSALIVSHDSRLMLLEIAVEKLFMPWLDVFDAALMKKTIVMFRMLDDEWSILMPNRRDYRSYRGSNYETEYFYGGRSVLFSVPEAVLEQKMSGVDLQLYVYRGISKYFELEPQRNFGFTLIRVDDLLNGIIKDLDERKELEGYFSRDLEREPISRSTRGTFTLLNDKLKATSSTVELYIRISYLDKCIITEMHTPMSLQKAFYAREETDEHYRYQFREVNTMDLESFCWGSATILPPLDADKLICKCTMDEETIRDTATATRRRRRRTPGRIDESMAARKLDGSMAARKIDESMAAREIDESMVARKLDELRGLIALMKEMRKNRPEVPSIGQETKRVCPPIPIVCPMVSPCPPPCVYALPTVSPNACRGTICCLPPSC